MAKIEGCGDDIEVQVYGDQFLRERGGAHWWR